MIWITVVFITDRSIVNSEEIEFPCMALEPEESQERKVQANHLVSPKHFKLINFMVCFVISWLLKFVLLVFYQTH